MSSSNQDDSLVFDANKESGVCAARTATIPYFLYRLLLWKISYPILPLIYPSYHNKDLKDWRIVLENMPESNYKPKTEQITYDE